MFESFKRYKSILVTGPQRSGTRIAAKIIAHDTGCKYIDETKIGVENSKKAKKFLNKGSVVLQAPGLCHVCHEFSDDVLIVIMIRSIVDILASEKRIDWKENATELKKYGKGPGFTGLACQRKYEEWEEQKKKIKHWKEINYEDLSSHPLWIPKEKRKNFKWNQTEF